jgi:hypothetical protein
MRPLQELAGEIGCSIRAVRKARAEAQVSLRPQGQWKAGPSPTRAPVDTKLKGSRSPEGRPVVRHDSVRRPGCSIRRLRASRQPGAKGDSHRTEVH